MKGFQLPPGSFEGGLKRRDDNLLQQQQRSFVYEKSLSFCCSKCHKMTAADKLRCVTNRGYTSITMYLRWARI